MEKGKVSNEKLKEVLWFAAPKEYFKLFPDEKQTLENMINEDCLFHIFEFFPCTSDFANIQRVCKRWLKVAQNEKLWKITFESNFGILNIKPNSSYRNFFKTEGATTRVLTCNIEPINKIFLVNLPKEKPKAITVYEFHAKLPDHCPGMGINFCTSNQILFHFNPRRNEGQIVCNSTTSGRGSWMHEERIMIPGKMLDRESIVLYFIWDRANSQIYWILDEKNQYIKYRNRFPTVEPEFIDLYGIKVEKAFKYEVTSSLFARNSWSKLFKAEFQLK